MDHHTGAYVSRDATRVDAIVTARLLGWSDRRIARELGCDVRVISAVVRRLEANGKLPALEKRLRRALGELAEESVCRLRETLEEPEPSPAMIRALSITAGIAADKYAGVASGEPARAPAADGLPPGSRVVLEWAQKVGRRVTVDIRDEPAEPAPSAGEVPAGPTIEVQSRGVDESS